MQGIRLVPDIQIQLPARLCHGIHPGPHHPLHDRRVEGNAGGSRIHVGCVLQLTQKSISWKKHCSWFISIKIVPVSKLRYKRF